MVEPWMSLDAYQPKHRDDSHIRCKSNAKMHSEKSVLLHQQHSCSDLNESKTILSFKEEKEPFHIRLSRPKHSEAWRKDVANAIASPTQHHTNNMNCSRKSGVVRGALNASTRQQRLKIAFKHVALGITARGIKGVYWRRRKMQQMNVNGSKPIEQTIEEQSDPLSFQSVSSIHGFLMQKDIRTLLAETNYDRRELFVMYGRFKALCALSPSPDGIDKHTFKKGVARLSVEDDLFVDRVFDIVDDDGSGCIEWEEFLTALSLLEKGSRDKKLQFFFRIYDIDGDGYISRKDLSTMFLSSSMLEPDQITLDLVAAFVERVFTMILGTDPQKTKLSLDDVSTYMKMKCGDEDIWEVFGRSMLKDFGTKSQ